MPIDNPPSNVGDLVAKVTKATSNVAKQRLAMAEIAAQAKTTNPQAPETEVKPQ